VQKNRVPLQSRSRRGDLSLHREGRWMILYSRNAAEKPACRRLRI
jgi:hypothetical protein